MANIASEIANFISEERGRFEPDDYGKFVVAFRQVLRYYNFLTIIKERYGRYNSSFFNLLEIQKPLLQSESGPLTEEQAAWWDKIARLNESIQLEVESYYLFAKILLDKIARFIEFFFGPGRKKPLDSHDQLTKNLRDYCEAKSLKDFEHLKSILASLKTDIADFRDYQIAHEKSPRTIHGVSWSGTGDTAIFHTKLTPRVTDTQVQSKSLGKLDEDLQCYMREIMSFVRSNRDKSTLKKQEHIA